MNYNRDLYLLINKLEYGWKDFFGLYTQYVGYLTPNMIKTLLLIKREFDEQSDTNFIHINLEEINNICFEMTSDNFSHHKEVNDVLPKLWDILKKFNLNNVSEDEWDQFISFLNSKIVKVGNFK